MCSSTDFGWLSGATRVDGALDSVNFVEGQDVKQGDLLVQIDPRPFQVQLDQAEAQLVKDQAILKNTKLELLKLVTCIFVPFST